MYLVTIDCNQRLLDLVENIQIQLTLTCWINSLSKYLNLNLQQKQCSQFP